MKQDFNHILVSEEEIKTIVSRLAGEIDKAYEGHRLLLVCVLKGAVVFFSDLLRKINMPVEIDFVKVSSYGSGTVSSGKLNFTLDIKREDLGDYDVLIIEDIIDSGNTLSALVRNLRERGAKSVKTCTFLDKPSRRTADYNADFVGKIIPDEFVIGYGLDFDEKYRDLPMVAVLDPSV